MSEFAEQITDAGHFSSAERATRDDFVKKEIRHMTLPTQGSCDSGDIKLVQRYQVEFGGRLRHSVKDTTIC